MNPPERRRLSTIQTCGRVNVPEGAALPSPALQCHYFFLFQEFFKWNCYQILTDMKRFLAVCAPSLLSSFSSPLLSFFLASLPPPLRFSRLFIIGLSGIKSGRIWDVSNENERWLWILGHGIDLKLLESRPEDGGAMQQNRNQIKKLNDHTGKKKNGRHVTNWINRLIFERSLRTAPMWEMWRKSARDSWPRFHYGQDARKKLGYRDLADETS